MYKYDRTRYLNEVVNTIGGKGIMLLHIDIMFFKTTITYGCFSMTILAVVP